MSRAATGGWEAYMRAIRRGDRGAAFAEIRSILHGLDRLPPSASPVAVSTAPPPSSVPAARGVSPGPGPEFDERTERAVRAFQQSRGLTADGQVDEETWRAL